MRSQSARERASRIACAAPFEPTGYIGCAASPMSVTRPWLQCGSGSRSHIGIFPADRSRAHQSLDIDVRNGEAPGVRDDLVHASRSRPGIDWRRRDLAVGDARDDRPVGEAFVGRRARRDRVERDLRAHAAGDIHRTAAQELRPFRCAAPEHQPLPFRATLFRVEMTAHHGVDAVGADEHVGAHGLAAHSGLGVGEMRDDPALVLHEPLQPEPRAHRAGTESRDDFVVDHLLQPAAMNRELRIVEAGVQRRAARSTPSGRAG